MKKIRNLLILLLAASLLTVFVACDNSQKEPPVDYSYATFAKLWTASGGNASKMPATPIYASMTADELNKFNSDAGNAAKAVIDNSIFKVTLNNKDVIAQKSDGTWTFTKYVEPKPEPKPEPIVPDYSYSTFDKKWKAAENNAVNMPSTPVYAKMTAKELEDFNKLAGNEAKATVKDSIFTVTFKNKDVLVQKADGTWSFTKYVEPKPEPKPEPEPELFPKNEYTEYFFIDLNNLGKTFRSGGTYISIEVNGKKILTTKDRFKFEGDGDINQIAKSFVSNNPFNADKNEYQWGYIAQDLGNNMLVVIPSSSDKYLPIDATWHAVGLGGHDQGTSKDYPIRPMYFANLNQLGPTFRAGGTYVSLVVNNKKIVTTQDRFDFQGDKNISLITKGLIANNPTTTTANKHQWGYAIMPAADPEYNILGIIPLSDDKILEGNTFTLVGLGGHGQSESKPMRFTTLIPTKPLEIDLAKYGDTFRSGATYISIEMNGKKVATTRDRFKFDGDRSITELVQGFLDNNPNNPSANEYQWGFRILPGDTPTKIKLIPTSPNVTIEGTSWKLVGLGGHGNGESAEFPYSIISK